MADIQTSLSITTPPATSSSENDKDALIARLDTLLEQYLDALDQYDKLTNQLSSQLSSAFFSLTQANFHNRSGVPFGQDRYDERVQATRRIVVTPSEEQQRGAVFSATCLMAKPGERRHVGGDGQEQSAEKDETETETPAPAAGDRDEGEKAVHGDKGNNDEQQKEDDAAESKLQDPIRMFGILVPPALRSAQAAFADAVQGPVVGLAGVAAELRALEREIGRARKSVRKAEA